MAKPDTAFLNAFDALPEGYSQGRFGADRWGLTVMGGPGDPVRKLYAERLAGGASVSFNLYTTAAGPQLKPCEMAAATCITFVLYFEPEP